MDGGRHRRAHTRAHTSIVRAFTRDWPKFLCVRIGASGGLRQVAAAQAGVKRTCVVSSSFVLTNLDRRVISCQNRRKHRERTCDEYAESEIFQPGFAADAG